MFLSSFPCFWPWIDVIFCHIPIPSHEILAGSLVFLLWVTIIPNKFGPVTPNSPFWPVIYQWYPHGFFRSLVPKNPEKPINRGISTGSHWFPAPFPGHHQPSFPVTGFRWVVDGTGRWQGDLVVFQAWRCGAKSSQNHQFICGSNTQWLWKMVV